LPVFTGVDDVWAKPVHGMPRLVFKLSERSNPMHRYFIAGITAVTLLVTAFNAAPARAQDQDLARLLAGIAALAIVGKAIHDRNERREVRKDYFHRDTIVHRDHVQRQNVITLRPLPQAVARKVLPRQCLRQVQTRNGDIRRAFGARCLERNYQHSNLLPRNCARQFETQRGTRWMYRAGCLRNNGFQIARN